MPYDRDTRKYLAFSGPEVVVLLFPGDAEVVAGQAFVTRSPTSGRSSHAVPIPM